ncbi:hypothetical protein FRC17_010124, partial [Serendipita sp. 399]
HSAFDTSVSTPNLMPVMCPACPRPSINIPANWMTVIPQAEHWLVRRFVHFDANFRLVLSKQTKRDPNDQSLWSDGGFFANPREYEEYLKTADVPQQEPSECSNHRALSNTSRSRYNHLEVTGIAGAGFVNLYKGERYVNSDFAISHIMRGMIGILEVVLSYDIACQYQRNFQARFERLSAFLLLPIQLIILFLIPKFHLPAHKTECRYRYSLNYCKKVGRTDGEAIERFWSSHNHLSGSTMRMTPGARMDTLNFHFNDWNWRKTVKMGSTLSERLKMAEEMLAYHTTLLSDLAMSIGEEKAGEWTALEDGFEIDNARQSIYQPIADQAPTRAQILQQLTQFNAPIPNPRVEGGNGYPAMVLWINDGLDIEESQHRLRVHAQTINDGSTERQRIDLNRKRATLLDRIATWKAHRPEIILEDDEDNGLLPEVINLPLPSTVPFGEQDDALRDIERQLREAQAFDYLRGLRKSLSQEIAVLREKERHHRGQEANFRSLALLGHVRVETRFNSDRYRTAYQALVLLGGDIHRELMPLRVEDVSAANVFRYTRELGRGFNTTTSWIWRQTQIGEEAQDDSWLQEVLRVQFLEAKVNRDRWAEECKLVRAELGYTLETFDYMRQIWLERVMERPNPGAMAHTHKMSSMYQRMAEDIRQIIAMHQ